MADDPGTERVRRRLSVRTYRAWRGVGVDASSIGGMMCDRELVGFRVCQYAVAWTPNTIFRWGFGLGVLAGFSRKFRKR